MKLEGLELTLGSHINIINVKYTPIIWIINTRQLLHHRRKIWILSSSGIIFKDILSLYNHFLIGNINQRRYDCSCGWNISGLRNRVFFVSTITFYIKLQDKWVSWSKYETCSLFLPVGMQTGGMTFISPVLIALEIPIYICISKTIRINTIKDSISLLWPLILLILLITPFIPLIDTRPTITIFLFITHVLPSVVIYLLWILGLLAPL